MAGSDSGSLLVVLLAVVALVGVGLALASFASQRSMWDMMGGGGMHRDNVTSAASPGGLEWGVLLASAVFFVGAAVLHFRGRPERALQAAAAPTPAGPAPAEFLPEAPGPRSETAPVPELALVKLLDDDERRMYLEIRDRGGEALQRDLVALGTFSKAKVTRVLDKLERKGLVLRERHGMTNRVRIVAKVSK